VKKENLAKLMGKLKTGAGVAAKEAFGDMQVGKFVSIGLKDNRIEVRSAGNADYLSRMDDILNTINRVIVAYAAAADPEAYKKEYAKKLYKMASSVTDGEYDDLTKIFAAFSSGNIDKARLISLISNKKVKDKPAGDEGEHEPESMREMVDEISAKFDLDRDDASRIMLVGRRKEVSNNDEAPTLTAYNNLLKDIKYYE